MGAVYKALDINLDRTVALRALNLDFNGNPDLEQRFRAEVKPLGNLNHTNLTTLYALIVEQGHPWIVTEFVEGETFQQMLQRRGPIPSEEAVALFRQALFGIGYAHRMGVVHRDIKPANIMLQRQGIVKVADFGLAKVLSARGVARAGARMGTPAYMSPELFLNRPVDVRSDIYSLGVTLYEMLAGKVPFSADNDYQVMSDHVNTPAPPLAQFSLNVPKTVEQAVLKALEKSPDARYQTVEEFGAALGNSLGVTVAAPALSAPAAVAVSAGPAVAPSVATGVGAHTVGPQPLMLAASTFFASRERKMIAAAVVAILVLAGVLAGMRIKASRAAAAAAQAQNAANTAAAPPDANAPPPAPDNGAAPAQGDAPADGVAVAPGAPAAGVAVVPGAAVGVAVAPAQPDGGGGDASQGVTIPAGTVVAVRMMDAVSSSANQTGQTFDANVDADVVVNGAVVVPAGSDAGVALINVAQVPVAQRSDVQLQLVRLNINGTDYRARSSVFEQQSLPRTKKSVAVAGARAAFGALGGVLGHGSAGEGAAAGAASTFVVYIAPQTRIQFTLRRSINVAQ